MPLYVRVVLTWSQERLKKRRTQKLLVRRTLKRSVLRVDAKAESLSVAIGGCAPRYGPGGEIQKYRIVVIRYVLNTQYCVACYSNSSVAIWP